MKVTNNDLNEFCITGYGDFRRLRIAGIVNPRPTSTTFSYKTYHPVDKLNISNKRDPALFPDFTNQTISYNWNRNAIATACNQDVEDALHDTYVPSTLDYISLFKGKQKFMYSVFVKIILTDQEKNF